MGSYVSIFIGFISGILYSFAQIRQRNAAKAPPTETAQEPANFTSDTSLLKPDNTHPDDPTNAEVIEMSAEVRK